MRNWNINKREGGKEGGERGREGGRDRDRNQQDTNSRKQGKDTGIQKGWIKLIEKQTSVQPVLKPQI